MIGKAGGATMTRDTNDGIRDAADAERRRVATGAQQCHSDMAIGKARGAMMTPETLPVDGDTSRREGTQTRELVGLTPTRSEATSAIGPSWALSALGSTFSAW